MDNKKIIKAFEVLAGRILELENDLNVSAYRMDKLKEIVERAEREAQK